MNHDMMAVREDSPNTSSSQDGIALLGMPKYLVRKFIVHVAISSEFEFPWNGSEFGSVAQELGIQLADTDIRTLVLKGFSSGCVRHRNTALVLIIRMFQYVLVDPVHWYGDRNEAKYKPRRRVRDTLGYRKDPQGDCHSSKEDDGQKWGR